MKKFLTRSHRVFVFTSYCAMALILPLGLAALATVPFSTTVAGYFVGAMSCCAISLLILPFMAMATEEL